jgi:hypothetical protein
VAAGAVVVVGVADGVWAEEQAVTAEVITAIIAIISP